MTGRPHVFQADLDIPADPYSGRRVCAQPGCHLPRGNACHTLPDTPEQAVSRSWAGDVEPSEAG